jgi:hypothetical protein
MLMRRDCFARRPAATADSGSTLQHIRQYRHQRSNRSHAQSPFQRQLKSTECQTWNEEETKEKRRREKKEQKEKEREGTRGETQSLFSPRRTKTAVDPEVRRMPEDANR